MKIVKIGKSGTGFCLNQKLRSSVQNWELKIVFIYDVIVTSQTNDTDFEKMITCGKFDICAPSSFGEIKTDRQTDRRTDSRHATGRIALCIFVVF